MMKLVGIVGSPAEQSYNRELLQFIQKEYADLIDLEILEIDQVPLFDRDESQLTDEGPVHTIVRKIHQAEGVIISTPEHNHTIPAGLSSLIEWLSYKVHPLRHKPVLIIGASYHNQGTSRSQLHLRQILEAPGVDAMTMPGTEFLLNEAKTAFDMYGRLKDEGTIVFLRSVIQKFMEYAKAIQTLKVKPELGVEDLNANAGTNTTIEGVEMNTNHWFTQASQKTKAVSGQQYVQLDKGLLTVDQINWLLNNLPVELSFIDNNNQYLYHNRPMDPPTLIKRHDEDLGSSLAHLYPKETHEDLATVIGQLRAGYEEHIPTYFINDQNEFVLHDYRALHDETGEFKGFYEYVQNLQPLVEWYLDQTGQQLVAKEATDWVTEEVVEEVVEETSQDDATTSASEH
ncbi:NAD(P)H-dependent oxidoreductase [Dolosicoccus paucivorans]|uniref:NAD(P)H-dependent oxidoreductase n=1 Tax=Dolosicoccus paucivorans TaxID=84521 RepID=UPI00088E7784|nr:NAD(P)H-dependent oxidoreductase [Dolosicoccus paucivorans]SDI33302.1 NAD(P)H-dependent FMN reductase [Dolosicoccus paucivorans]